MGTKTLKGMYDVLPDEAALVQFIHHKFRSVCALYGYGEIKTPILEEANLFKKSIGDATDIVQKEMYAFIDRGGRNICLRPEGTASVVRAVLEHHLLKKNPIVKLFYSGPMFRAERPQAGRNRQFYQFGVEAAGSYDMLLDAEVIALNAHLLEEIGITDFEIQINSLGSTEDKNAFRTLLRKRLKNHGYDQLCATCHTRFETNVLRILDCKEKGCQKITGNIVAGIDHLSGASLEKYDKLKGTLQDLGVRFIENPRIVRGLDYYTHTVFEVTSKALGAQDAISAGGRYDNLYRSLGSRDDIGACGFALGIDRLLMIAKPKDRRGPDIYFVALGEQARRRAFLCQKNLRSTHACSVHMDYADRSIKKQMAAAAKSGAKVAVIIGDDEMQKQKAQVKVLRSQEQITVDFKEMEERVVGILSGEEREHV